jgi:hypothetical protein
MLPPLSLSTIALVLANLVPLAGAAFGGWSVYELLLLFWAENVVIGLFQVLRMGGVLLLLRRLDQVGLIPFFILHYGMFAFVHGMVVTGSFGPPAEAPLAGAIALLLSPSGLLFALLALVASHGFSFMVNFLGAGEWRDAEMPALMKQPYARVIVLHLVILGGGAAAVALGEPLAALVMLVVLKTAVDVVAHRRAHLAAQGGR